MYPPDHYQSAKNLMGTHDNSWPNTWVTMRPWDWEGTLNFFLAIDR